MSLPLDLDMTQPSGKQTAGESLRGRRLGPYRIVTELGSGGMGAVWYAEHDRIGRRVAIKVLHPSLSQDPEPVARFFREARAANAIRHPNIVDITDIGEQDGLVYLVMELLEGETLGARLERVGQLDLDGALSLTAQIAAPLAAAHDRGIVHRDLKPENIFLCAEDNAPDRVKLLDFGIAKLATSMGGNPNATRPGMVLGTPAYMAPEQCLGDQELDHRADQYALGLVVYEMLAGKPPFSGNSFGRLCIAHTTQDPERLEELVDEVPTAVADVIHRALAKSPDNRYKDVREFLSALVGSTHGRPESIAPQGPSRAERLDLERRQSFSVGRELTKILRRRIAYGRAQLPAMPHVVSECMALMEQGADLGEVATTIERDPLVTSRLLRVVNSPAFCGRETIASVRQAVSRLGSGRMRSLLLELSVRRVFVSSDPRIRVVFKRLWEHCLAVGTLARAIAAEIEGGPHPDEAYLAGLLHDVGKPIVGAFLLDAERSLSSGMDANWMTDSVWLRVVEQTHREAGTALAKEWQMPTAILETIEQPDRYLPNSLSCGNIVRYANSLARLEGLDAGEIDQAEEHAVALDGRRLFDLDEELEAKMCLDVSSRVREMTGDSKK